MSDGITLGEVIQLLDLMWRIGSTLSSASLKLYHVLYYAKHEGQTSFRRLTKVSDSLGFLDISTQDPKVLGEILQKMKDYRIQFSVLPDLQLNDNRTQIAFDFSQAPAVQALTGLLAAEKLEKLRELKSRHEPGSNKYQSEKAKIDARFPAVSLITADDYALTRLDQHGKETAEYKKLERSAKENMKKEEEKRKEEGKQKSEEKKKEEPSTEQKILAVQAVKQAEQNKELLSSGKAEILQLPKPMEKDSVQVAGKSLPVHRVRYPDGDLSVIIPNAHILDEKTVLIEKGRDYRVLSNQQLRVSHMKGSVILTDIRKQLEKNISKDVTKEAVLAPSAAPKPKQVQGKGRKR